jgi:hypothetical protein
MKRKVLVLALGVSFLIGMTWVGTILTEIIPRPPTAQTQTAQAGPYQLTLQVNPNPPRLTTPATLTLFVVNKSTHQPITDAQVSIESTMETMDMGTDHISAQSQHNGTYLVPLQFTMSGSWQVRVLIATPGAQVQSATFEITAQ